MLHVRNVMIVAATASLPLLAGCSSGSGIASVTPNVPIAMTAATVSNQGFTTNQNVVARVTTQSVVAQQPSFVPSGFPAAALPGAQSRVLSAAWDSNGASTPAVKVFGPGSDGAKVSTYTRGDGTSVVAIYFVEGTNVASGWLGIDLGTSARVPRTASFSDSAGWSDQSPWLGWSTTLYQTPARVLLIDLLGAGPTHASPAPSAPPATAAPTARPSAAPTARPSAAPTARPSAAPTARPTSVPTARPTTAPTSVPTAPSGGGGEGPASGGTGCPHFASNPVCAQLPSNPSVSGSSAAWAAVIMQPGRAYFPKFNGYVPPGTTSQNDGSLPLDELPAGAASVAQVIDCNAVSYGVGTCTASGIQGKTIKVPAIMLPAGNSDHHYSWNDSAAQGEYDFWLSPARGNNDSTLHLGGGGFCRWSGDGTACSGSTATNIASSLGTIHAYALKAAEADPVHGTLGYAIATSALCAASTWVYPANYSDGANTNYSSACAGHTANGQRPPEGTRWFLALTDAQIDATNNAPYVKVLLRTMDQEHFGGFISDTNWYGAPGLTPQYDRGDFRFAAAEAGVSTGAYGQVPFTLNGIDLATSVRFCTNGNCR